MHDVKLLNWVHFGWQLKIDPIEDDYWNGGGSSSSTLCGTETHFTGLPNLTAENSFKFQFAYRSKISSTTYFISFQQRGKLHKITHTAHSNIYRTKPHYFAGHSGETKEMKLVRFLSLRLWSEHWKLVAALRRTLLKCDSMHQYQYSPLLQPKQLAAQKWNNTLQLLSAQTTEKDVASSRTAALSSSMGNRIEELTRQWAGLWVGKFCNRIKLDFDAFLFHWH